jgi:hypothetical protein
VGIMRGIKRHSSSKVVQHEMCSIMMVSCEHNTLGEEIRP